jgi:hypothetical protein
MSTTPQIETPMCDVLTGAAVCAAGAALVAAASALAIALTGLADDTRRLLDFGFAGVERTPAQATSIALHNARFVVVTLIFAILRPDLPRPVRTIVDALLAAVLTLNAGELGVALGAYRERAAAATALHAPLEFSALALAGGAYTATRKQPLALPALARIAVLCALLLAAAATLETYASLGDPR